MNTNKHRLIQSAAAIATTVIVVSLVSFLPMDSILLSFVAFCAAVTVGMTMSLLMSQIAENRIKKRDGTVFISYAVQDKTFVRELVSLLERNRFRVVYDENVLKIGDNIKEKIAQCINESDLIIGVFSRKTDEHSFFHEELKYAISANKIVFPLVIDKDVELPSELSHIMFADFTENRKEVEKLLIGSLVLALNEINGSTNRIGSRGSGLKPRD